MSCSSCRQVIDGEARFARGQRLYAAVRTLATERHLSRCAFFAERRAADCYAVVAVSAI